MGETLFISVILPLKLEWEPCYSVPEDIAAEGVATGDRARVIFAGREYIGVVSAINIIPDTDSGRIKPILGIERDMGRVLESEIELWRKVAEYYLCTIGEVSKAAYPYGKISLEEARANAKSRIRERRQRLAESIRAKIARLEIRLGKKQESAVKAKKASTKEAFLHDIHNIVEELSKAQDALNLILGNSTASGAGCMAKITDDKVRYSEAQKNGIRLTEAQDAAVARIKDGFSSGKPVLLHGVTGSGKTEIYIKLALETLDKEKNVLYLVPEIALSRQLEDRLYTYFGNSLMTFHSGESAANRRNTAEAIREMSAAGKGNYIVLGTRSSLFLPHHNLGLIIIDEEHDTSYKQDSPAPRYNGRDTALMLHILQGCNILLGSATPSLEELYNCSAGRHAYIRLNERYHGSENADVEMIDTRAERRKRGMVGNFSRKLIAHINSTLERGEQIMILRSRRSWAPAMQCESCGEIVKCPHCNVSMCLHRNEGHGRMICHYCGFSSPYTGSCTKCNGSLASIGAGTQKIEEEAANLFPNARIARLDSDTAQSKSYETRTIKEFAKGEIDILVGTQMVTKGFDFEGLSLVAVIAADTLLGMQDFRADEKALQTLGQFRGRCGRRGKKGLFVIQTSQPEHPIYRKLMEDDITCDSDLMQERRDFHFPPYSRIVEIIIKDRIEQRGERMAIQLCSMLKDSGPVTGPYSPAINKIADMHIRSIRISLPKDKSLQGRKRAIRQAVTEFERKYRYDGHISINVDPS